MKFEEIVKIAEGKCICLRNTRRYFTFIQQRSKVLKVGYVEKHHILPSSIFPEYKKEAWNIVELSAREHYIAHYILMKAFGGSMSIAFNLMSNRFKGLIKSNQYHQGRNAHAVAISEKLLEWHKNNDCSDSLRRMRSIHNAGKMTAYDTTLQKYVRVDVDKLTESLIPVGKLRSMKSKSKTSKAMSDRKHWHDPTTGETIFIKMEEVPPQGFVTGASVETNQKISETMKKKFWWNNPKTMEQIRSEFPPNDQWVRGRINFGKTGNPFKKVP